MSFPHSKAHRIVVSDHIASYVDEIHGRRKKPCSRIACTAFSQAKWYINTSEKTNKSRCDDERRVIRSVTHISNLRITATKTTIARVDYYMRHGNISGRFLREATGTCSIRSERKRPYFFALPFPLHSRAMGKAYGF